MIKIQKVQKESWNCPDFHFCFSFGSLQKHQNLKFKWLTIEIFIHGNNFILRLLDCKSVECMLFFFLLIETFLSMVSFCLSKFHRRNYFKHYLQTSIKSCIETRTWTFIPLTRQSFVHVYIYHLRLNPSQNTINHISFKRYENCLKLVPFILTYSSVNKRFILTIFFSSNLIHLATFLFLALYLS